MRELYGFIYPCWEYIIITSNKAPWFWYKHYDVDAMCKRFTDVWEFFKNEKNERDKRKLSLNEIRDNFIKYNKEKEEKNNESKYDHFFNKLCNNIEYQVERSIIEKHNLKRSYLEMTKNFNKFLKTDKGKEFLDNQNKKWYNTISIDNYFD